MADPTPWHPVIASARLRAGVDVVGTRVLGHELALWRSADGRAQAWDDRCPHRSVRLSLGQVRDNRLACAYHGWAYEADSGRLAAIPAMPHQPVPGRVCASAHAVTERDGMVWVAPGLAPDAAPPRPGRSAPPDRQWLRSLALRCAPDPVRALLARRGFEPDAAGGCDGLADGHALRIHLQPCDPALSLLHAWLHRPAAADAVPAVLAWLRALRASAEAEAATAAVSASP